MKKYKNIILWVLTTAVWTILTLLLTLWRSNVKDTPFQDTLTFTSLGMTVFGILLIMSRGATRSPVEFSARSHLLFPSYKADSILTNNHGKRYGYDYNWKFFFNGYSILVAGIICVLILVIII